MMIIFIILGLIYLISMLICIMAWHRIPKENESKPEHDNNPLSVSVIIPIRNEALHIEKLLRQLASQDYPREFFEIIVVNDHSDDLSESIVKRVIDGNAIDMHLISLPTGENGKKAALLEGVNLAKGSILITTDGDCQVGPKWLKTVSTNFDDEVKMTFGPVAINKNGIFSNLQIVDFAALIGIGAATWKLGMPGMCNGANLAFRKITFMECNGYEGTENHPSGDDEFLLRKIHMRYPNGIRFIKSESAMVFTNPLPNIHTFLQQRIRWAGKWKLHKDVATKSIAIFVFLFYVVMLTATGQAFILREHIDVIMIFWIGKWVLDVLLVGSVLKLSKQRLPIIESLILSVIYPFYAIVIGISTINYTFEWKGRKY